MSAADTSSTFDGRIAAALVVGPLLPLVLHAHAPAWLLPALVAATMAQFMLQFSRQTSRCRMALFAGLLGFVGIGWPLYAFGGIH